MDLKFKVAASVMVLILSVALLNNLYVFDNFCSEQKELSPAEGMSTPVLVEKPEMVYGLPKDSFEIVESVVQNGESFSTILLDFGVSYETIHKIANDFKEIFDVRNLRSGKKYSLFCENGIGHQQAHYMVYEPSPVQYYVFELKDSVKVYERNKEVTIKEKVVSGKIESSLYETIRAQGGSPALTMELSTIYAWSIDFFRIKKGDYFKVIYEEKYVDDTVYVGMGKILAADFNHGDKSFYSFWYENKTENYSEYFDEEGNTLRKAFLKAPLNYSRISSRYSPRRFHPVLKRYKSHLGTDYAAPRGTPIMSTADGEVIAAAYTSGNGNYVKVRHNSTYTTQYLHMSKFAKGIKKGTVVKQGDVIGYVGSTGLATGPHVCYRFWVNGQQVDPYKQDLPDAEPILEEYKADYLEYMQALKNTLDAIQVKEFETKPDVHLASIVSPAQTNS